MFKGVGVCFADLSHISHENEIKDKKKDEKKSCSGLQQVPYSFLLLDLKP